MNRLIRIISISIVLLLIVNCRKKDDDMSTPLSKTVQANRDGAEGSFTTWKEYKLDRSGPFPHTVTFKTGVAQATISSFGDVYCEGIKLILQFVIHQSDTNINFNQDVNWVVQGNASNQGFNFTDTTGFPYMSKIKSTDTLKRNSDFTISFDTLTNADFIHIRYFGVDTTVSGKVNSFTFKKSQIEHTLSDGEVSNREFFITPYSHSAHLINGKKFYFQNRFVRYKEIVMVGK